MLRILYAGSPDVSAVLLKQLLQSQGDDYQIVGVLTNPPSRKGRKSTLMPTPVETVAKEYDACIPVFTPEHLDKSTRDEISETTPNLLVCFAYGKIFGPKFMALFEKGGVNVHPSLLPKYRGCAPVPATILNREKKTGITIQRLAQEMDTGDILSQVEISLDGTENAELLLNKAAQMSVQMMKDVLHQIDNGTEKAVPQTGEATYCSMLKKEDGEIDWQKSAAEIDAQIRAFYPWPGAFTSDGETVLHIHQAALYNGTAVEAAAEKPFGTVLGTDKKSGILVKTGDGILAVTNLQWQAKKAMNWKDFMNGSGNIIGKILKKVGQNEKA